VKFGRETVKSFTDFSRHVLSGAAAFADTRPLHSLPAAMPDLVVAACVAVFDEKLGSNAELAHLTTEVQRYLIRLIDCMPQNLAADPNLRRLACAFRVLLAVANVASFIERGIASSDRKAADRALLTFAKWGAILDQAHAEMEAWLDALTESDFDLLPGFLLYPGLTLALMPIDHEASEKEIRITEAAQLFVSTRVDPLAIADEIARCKLICRTLSIICSAAPYDWQQIATVAALSSFESRTFFFVDIAGSGSLKARIGNVPMEEFAHVTLRSTNDLGPIGQA
jgi:hypothetical protein